MTGITLRRDGATAIIEIDNGVQNRFTAQMIADLDDAITRIAESDARVVLLTGLGPNFSVGMDINSWPDKNPAELRSALEKVLAAFNRFEQLPIPTVAAITGIVTGGAYELILRADFVLAGSSARLGSPEESLGMVTGLGGIIRTAERAGRAFAIDVAFNSTIFDAQTAFDHGLVTRVMDDADLPDAVNVLVSHLAAGPTIAYGAMKAMIRSWASGGIAATEQVILDLTAPAFSSNDAHRALVSAVEALAAGAPRPQLTFTGK